MNEFEPPEVWRKERANEMAVNGILGIKLGMTQIFADDGTAVPCTVLQAGPCVVVQRRTKQADGYDAVQLGLVEFIKPQRVNKARSGHFKKANVAPLRYLHEIKIEDSKDEAKSGDHRAPGGIGASSFPSRVWKGQHMPGHMGHERKTSKNLRVVKVDSEENLLLVRGAVAGPQGSYIFIRKVKAHL